MKSRNYCGIGATPRSLKRQQTPRQRLRHLQHLLHKYKEPVTDWLFFWEHPESR